VGGGGKKRKMKWGAGSNYLGGQFMRSLIGSQGCRNKTQGKKSKGDELRANEAQ